MGRRRKEPTDAWVPKRVYRGKSSWEWKTPGGKTVRLCRLDQPASVVIQRWQEAVAALPVEDTVAWIVSEYWKSDEFALLSKVTQADYRQCSQKPLLVFGKMRARGVTPEQITRYVSTRAKSSVYRANRELSWLKTIFGYAASQGWVRANPCAFTKPRKGEKVRTLYVHQEMYQKAFQKASAPVQVAMELAYTTGLRQADILSMTWKQVKPDGIHVEQQKTGKPLIKQITPRVQAALDLAKTLPKPSNVECWYVVHNRSGQRYTRSGFNSVWHRLNTGFHFHDLRRAGATDMADADRAKFTGHTSSRMAERYNAKPIESPSH